MINVVYTCDDNYVWLMCVSMLSLFENNPREQFDVYLLGEGISENSEANLRAVADNYGQNFQIISTDSISIPQGLCSSRWPKSAYSRLFCGELLPDSVHKAVYLDCDTIVQNDFSAIMSETMDGAIFAGVLDCVSGRYKKNIGIPPTAGYVNAGVLLIDVDALRKIDVRLVIDDFLNKYQKKLSYADQDVLNGAFSKQIGYLSSPAFNLMTQLSIFSFEELTVLRKPEAFYSEKNLIEAQKNPIVIHYTTCMLTIRPWFDGSDHPLKDQFIRFLAISPYKDKGLSSPSLSSRRDRFFQLLSLMPKPIGQRILGFMHVVIKPLLRRYSLG